jgi:hypothetical protein
MKKVFFILFALVIGQLSAQDLGAIAGDAASALSSDAFIDQIAGDQLKSLAKKFNFTDAQAEQASTFVKESLKSPKVQKALGKYSPDQLLSPDGLQTIQNTLLGNKKFMKKMKGFLNPDQFGMMSKAASLL